MPSTMYADTSRLMKPWRPPGLYANLPFMAQQAMSDDDDDDPARKMLMEMGAQRSAAGGAISTRAQEIQSRIAGAQTGARPTTSGLKSMIPTEAASAMEASAAANKGSVTSWMNQLSEIGRQGQLATERQRALAAYAAQKAAAQAKAQAAASGGGGGSIPAFSGSPNKRRQAIINAARKWLGTPYSWGGGSLTGPSFGIGRGAGTRGFDCSGLVRMAYARAGISMPRVSQAQMTRGVRAPIRSLQPGDLVGKGQPAHHIAIYLGGGRIIEAPFTGARVRIRSIGSGAGWWGIHVKI